MAESERPSRQDLVVPPRQSSFPLVLGALLCAGTGFGLVMALGIGRSSADRAAAPPEVQFAPATANADEASPAVEPGPFPGTGHQAESPHAGGDPGWRPQPAAVPRQPVDERYPARPAALETPADAQPIEPADRGLSRFSAPGRFPGTGDERVRLAAAVDDEPLSPEPDGSGVGGVPVPLAGDPADLEAPSASDQVPIPPPVPEAAPGDEPVPSAATNPPADDLAPPMPPTDSPVASVQETVPEPPSTTAAAPFPPGASAQPFRPEAWSADLPPPAAPAPLQRPAPGFAPEPPLPAMPVPTRSQAFTVVEQAGPPGFAAATAAPAVPVAAANPFVTAVPMVPPAASDRGPGIGGPFSATTAPAGAAAGAPPAGPFAGGNGGSGSGQGRPGPMQLEGVQTPQLAVEKRGPREIQVGKPARYEIVVRNVGNAAAQDVTLRDAVPYGTTLIATTPPANPIGPSASPAELLWPLGPLLPGGEARVSIEVMPQIEGELGSVASVSFRTEASARSRATKPDLRLEATETKPVRIGGDVQLSLKISNPGTGVATGVVLEGLLPDGVTHRAGRELEFDVGQLRPGESRTIDLTMTSTGPGVHQARFTARADGRIEIEQVVRIEITAPTLELTAEMPSRRYLQRPATCLLSMINAGTAPARSIELVAQLPPGMKFVRANHAGWYEERSHRVLWNLEELPPGDVGAVELVVMPVDLGPQKIVAAARSSDGLSDQTAHTVEVEGVAAMFFEVTDSEDPIEVGGVTEYIVRVGNQGTKAASGVRLAATLLGDLEPVDAKGPAAHRIENLTFVFEPLVKLAPSEEAVYRVRVRGRREGDQRMQVQLSSDDHPAPITKEEITRVYADR